MGKKITKKIQKLPKHIHFSQHAYPKAIKHQARDMSSITNSITHFQDVQKEKE